MFVQSFLIKKIKGSSIHTIGGGGCMHSKIWMGLHVQMMHTGRHELNGRWIWSMIGWDRWINQWMDGGWVRGSKKGCAYCCVSEWMMMIEPMDEWINWTIGSARSLFHSQQKTERPMKWERMNVVSPHVFIYSLSIIVMSWCREASSILGALITATEQKHWLTWGEYFLSNWSNAIHMISIKEWVGGLWT